MKIRKVTEYKHLRRTCNSVKERDRIKAILMLNKGYSFEEVADILIMDEDSIRRWYKLYDEGGIESLSFQNYKGSVCFLNNEQQIKLSKNLEENIFLIAKEVCVSVPNVFCL